METDRTKLTLRRYQQECVDICNALEGGSFVVQMATGLGKTVTFANIERKGRVLLLAHRREILKQAQSYYNIPVGIEMNEDRSNGEEVVAASVQSLIHRLHHFSPNDFDMIITDEAHHAVAPSYRKIYDYFNPRLHLGFTATPNRGDKVRLTDVYEGIVYSRDLKWGIDNSFLSDIDCRQVVVSYNPKKIKTSRDKTLGITDFQTRDLDAALNTPQTNKQITDAYEKYSVGQTLIFAASVPHAYALSKLIPNSRVLEAKTPPTEREQMLNDFTNRKYPCLINNLILTEGTDLPVIDTVIIARPTRNETLYTQMVGRGLRIYDGKQALRLIDCVGVATDHNLCTAPTLLGLDPQRLEKKYRGKAITGLLSEMEDRFLQYDNQPAVWVLHDKRVSLFQEEHGCRFNNVDWTPLSNGTLVVTTTNIELRIPPVDLMGITSLELYDKRTKLRLRTEAKGTLQEMLDKAYQILLAKAGRQQSLWDKRYKSRWENKPASEKQTQFVKALCTKDELDDLYETLGRVRLTKGEAGKLITNGQVRQEQKDVEANNKKPAADYQIREIRNLYANKQIPGYIYKVIDFENLDSLTAYRIIKSAKAEAWKH